MTSVVAATKLAKIIRLNIVNSLYHQDTAGEQVTECS